MTEYQTIAGTPADPEVQHEPRTVQRIESTEFYIMSEIGDGVFVQWSTCARCSKQVASCICGAGPQEAEHIIRWRTQRFEKSFAERGIESRATPRAVKGLLEDAQAAQDAAYGDSNDDEIDLLRGALETALSLLGLSLPDGVDPDAVPDEPEVDEARTSSVFERPPGNVYQVPEDAFDDNITPLETMLGIKPEPIGEAVERTHHAGPHGPDHVLGVKPEPINETVDDALAAGLERVKEAKGHEDVGF